MKKAKEELQKKGLVLGFPAIAKPSNKLAECSKRTEVNTTRGATAGEKHVDKTPVSLEVETVNKSNERTKSRRFFSTAKKKGLEVVPEPKGRPDFMLFAAKGTNKLVQVFFDSGCSDAVMREGIPGVEWKGIVTKRGPFGMGGVDGIS